MASLLSRRTPSRKTMAFRGTRDQATRDAAMILARIPRSAHDFWITLGHRTRMATLTLMTQL
jgi:hypothetical protein